MNDSVPEIQDAVESIRAAIAREEAALEELDSRRRSTKKQLTELKRGLRGLTSKTSPRTNAVTADHHLASNPGSEGRRALPTCSSTSFVSPGPSSA